MVFYNIVIDAVLISDLSILMSNGSRKKTDTRSGSKRTVLETNTHKSFNNSTYKHYRKLFKILIDVMPILGFSMHSLTKHAPIW